MDLTQNLTVSSKGDLKQPFRNYVKNPVTIDAIALTTPRIVDTLEGPVKANAGDILIHGVDGEYYPCNPQTFAETYERLKAHVSDDRETPQETLQALTLQEGMPQKTHLGWQRYQSRPVHVKAAPIKERLEIETQRGTLIGDAGDMLIRRSDTDIYPCKPDIFAKTYKRDAGQDCFEIFNPDIHLINSLTELSPEFLDGTCLAGIVTGFSRACICVWIHYTSTAPVVYRELRLSHAPSEMQANAIMKHNTEPSAVAFYAHDSAAQENHLKAFRKHGLPVKGFTKRNVASPRYLEMLAERLEDEKLLFCKDACIQTESLQFDGKPASLIEELQTPPIHNRNGILALITAIEVYRNLAVL